MKNATTVFLFLSALLACAKKDTAINPVKGMVMFRYDGGNSVFTTDDFVDITLDNTTQQIRNGFGLNVQCGINDIYSLSRELNAGDYSYKAKTQIGRTLTGTVTVKSGNCTTVQLK
jgi:hypothetical protein